MQREKGLDIRVKQQLRKPVIFCDLINGGLFCGEQRLHPEMLQRMPEILNYSEEQTERDYRSYERIPDVVYAAGAGEGYLVLMKTRTVRIKPCRCVICLIHQLPTCSRKKQLKKRTKKQRT